MALSLKKNEPAPYSGILMPEDELKMIVGQKAAADAELKNTKPTVNHWIIDFLAGIAVGFIAGSGRK